MSRTRLILFASIAIVAALAGAFLAREIFRSGATPVTLQSGTILQPPRPLPVFSLLDQDRQVFDNGRLVGHWSLLFFGFTNCGDVCPTTLALLAAMNKTFDGLSPAQRPRVIFISVDGQRDNPDSVKAYVKNFDVTFIGVTGRQSDLDALTSAVGVPSAVRQLENGAYAVDHSAAILAIDPRGEFRAIFSPPHTLDALASDYRSLIGTT